MGLSIFEVAVEPCWFVADRNNFVYWATPDDRVVMEEECGILELKYLEEYKSMIYCMQNQ